MPCSSEWTISCIKPNRFCSNELNAFTVSIALCGGMEGENLGREMSKFLIKKGYNAPVLMPAAMTGNYEIIEYYMAADGAFKIIIHPRANVAPIQ